MGTSSGQYLGGAAIRFPAVGTTTALVNPAARLLRAPTPSRSRLQSGPRQRSEWACLGPGTRKQMRTPRCNAHPRGCRASRGAPRAECRSQGGSPTLGGFQ
eukprot:3397665-Alexandrium_andersonii.AAC.2